MPRVRRLPDGRLTHVRELYTAGELKTSPTYNELMRRCERQDSLNVRLDGADGSHITWGLGDPVDSDGWGSSRIAMVKGLLPHIRQFVRVRQALVRAEARSTTVTALLDNPRLGVVHLDRRGRVMAANDRARGILRRRDGLSDRKGMLRARAPADQARLEPGTPPISAQAMAPVQSGHLGYFSLLSSAGSSRIGRHMSWPGSAGCLSSSVLNQSSSPV